MADTTQPLPDGQEKPWREHFAVPIMLAWSLAAAAKFADARSHDFLAALAVPSRMIAPEVWWCGFVTQAVICIFTLTGWRKHTRTALLVMAGFWISTLANATLWVLHWSTV